MSKNRTERIKSDEHWFWHEGSPLTLHILEKNGYQSLHLGPIGIGDCKPQGLVSKNLIFGSTVDEIDTYVLVSCVVAPGFDFRDFELLDRKTLLSQFPENQAIIERLT